MRFGEFVMGPTSWPFVSLPSTSAEITVPPSQYMAASSLYNVVLQWLIKDREYRQEFEKQGRKASGAKQEEVCGISFYSSLFF